MKMVTGQPYSHFMDHQLIDDRKQCKRALDSYNKMNGLTFECTPAEKERYFAAVYDPSARTFVESSDKWVGPRGEIGCRTIVETPFSCEYGYNLKLGESTLISAGCVMEDAAPISIGDRVIVGKNVKFYCITTSLDPKLRAGSQGDFTAGAIKVEDDVIIGADSLILPFRTIGKGAVVGAGSVVTRDIKPFTVVAGNPAKQIRKRKIESGRDNDRHEEGIQEENDRMLKEMKKHPYGRDRML